jgi:hypothetical protein
LNDPSDPENFSEIIGFNDRKDQNDLELSELEIFIKEKYKNLQMERELSDNNSSEEDD